MSMPIFSPTVKPAAFATGKLVEPTGIVSHGPVETGANTVVIAVAAVPTFLMTRVSPSILICCPLANPVVLLTGMLVAPARAGADSPEFERPSRNQAPPASFVPVGIVASFTGAH